MAKLAKKFTIQSLILTALVSAIVAGAGVYTWQQRELKAALKPYQKTDEQQIIEAAKAQYQAPSSTSNSIADYGPVGIKDNFASINVHTPTAGGFAYILKKVNGHWVVITTAQNPPSKEFGERYGLPKDWYQSR